MSVAHLVVLSQIPQTLQSPGEAWPFSLQSPLALASGRRCLPGPSSSEGLSTRYLRFLVPKTIPLTVLGDLEYWVLGPSGIALQSSRRVIGMTGPSILWDVQLLGHFESTSRLQMHGKARLSQYLSFRVSRSKI